MPRPAFPYKGSGATGRKIKNMSVIKNSAANLLAQVYALAINLITLPLFLEILGPEAYGLVGFYSVLFALLVIFDLGMSPALSRQVASLKCRPEKRSELAVTVSTFEVLFAVTTVAVGALLVLLAPWFAESWLVNETLDVEKLDAALIFMAFALALRWHSTIYKSVLNGLERQVWVGGYEAAINTFRFPLLVILMASNPGEFHWFFAYQAVVSLVEVLVLRWKSYAAIPQRKNERRVDWVLTRPMLPFAVGAGYASALGVLQSQYDKVLMSAILPLAEYGYFALIAVITSGLVTFTAPISKAILPRLTALFTQGDLDSMLVLYQTAALWMVVILSPIYLTISVWPYETIFAWTGNYEAAEWLAPVLPLFTLGVGLLTISMFQYFLQYAHGDLTLNVKFSTVLCLLLIPALTFIGQSFGVSGVAWCLLLVRILIFAIWLPYVHHKLAPGLHKVWLIRSVLLPMSVSLAAVLIVKLFSDQHFAVSVTSQSATFLFLAGVTIWIYLCQALWLFRSGRLDAVRSALHKSGI